MSMTSVFFAGFLSFLVLSMTAQAEAVGPCAKLRAFTMQFQTGADDLRKNSEVIVWLTTQNGDVELQHLGGSFASDSTTSRIVTFLNGNWDVDSCSVTGVKVRMVSHPSHQESDDTWILNGFSIKGYAEGGRYRYQLSATGAPLNHFSSSNQWWEHPKSQF